LQNFQLWKRAISSANTGHIGAVELQAVLDSTEYCQLAFDFRFIIDEFVHFGLRGYVGHFVFQLALLLFSSVLRDPALAPVAATEAPQPIWNNFNLQLKYLLDHFPKSYKGTAALRSLYHSVRRL
jgi:hypothetical protein